MARALGDDVRERGLGELVTELREETREQLEPHVGVQASCRITGISRSTLYRRRMPRPEKADQVVRPDPSNALTQAERDELIAVLNSEEFRDKAVRQVWAALLDRGVYLASPSTMYRELVRHEALLYFRMEVRDRPLLCRRSGGVELEAA